ncbi:enoyl-CoA hydratase/isomerase family protein [Variovorax saccharolyticus]|uniref:enoyl-CoA hydratase/isomerase family protein n=1 Tax=Variovorax saccharolyticus TaxID=3053516 RepID=UPI0025766CC1|nr:enoyl-CoA hydratase-related protein [Variovorax sp. J22R187]MDM0018821.1 enoyl-CoA hydratase-related protein [Variovorax sp. J22R187]
MLNPEVDYEVVDGCIAVVTINRPAQRNAINRGVVDGLRRAWRAIEDDDAVRVGILTGSGEQAFCAGMDLKEAAATGLKVPPRDMLPVLGDVEHVGKPMIAAVNGVAYAGGFLFAQMCDLCVAAEHARFGITEAKVGRGMPWAAPLAHMLPQRVMMELLLTGQPMSAQRAMALGFVNDVVPMDRLRERALELARTIAANAPLTVKAARELVYLSTEMGRSAALRAARHLFEGVYLSDDAQEGPKAFAEKRTPRWTGR